MGDRVQKVVHDLNQHVATHVTITPQVGGDGGIVLDAMTIRIRRISSRLATLQPFPAHYRHHEAKAVADAIYEYLGLPTAGDRK